MSKAEAEVSRQSFKVTACIDWLDVVIETFRPSQHQHVRETLRGITGTKLWVETLDKRAGNVGTAFRLRIHDLLANDYQKLRKSLDEFAIRYPIAPLPLPS